MPQIIKEINNERELSKCHESRVSHMTTLPHGLKWSYKKGLCCWKSSGILECTG